MSADKREAVAHDGDARPLVTIVLPAFNEAAILADNLQRLTDYLDTLRNEYRFEIVLINDGSRDATGEIAERFARGRNDMRVLHHPSNFGLGQAFKYGFANSHGDYVVTMDVDLSYSPEHVVRLLERIRATKGKLVLASPYMEGGQISNVPTLRMILSKAANRFLSWFAHGHLSTLTCMVRAYDGRFIRQLHLRATGMDVMPETVYKTMIQRGRIDQIPAHLDWGPQLKKAGRRSSMRILRHVFSTILSGFLFRPFMFFVLPGLALLAFSLYVNAWMVIHFVDAMGRVPDTVTGVNVMSAAVAIAYADNPHTFIVGLLSLMLAVQLMSLGILALQNKAYFEEIFHLASTMRRELREDRVEK
jgi:glycosyltransferase involved in cell wall biosynthesis